MREIIERAYEVFAAYPAGPLRDTSGSECSDDALAIEMESSLTSKPLRQLDEHDLADYYYLAIQHVGTVDHFRHYLPRILEIISADPHGPMGEALLHRLQGTDVASWPLQERQVIREFFRAVPAAAGDFGTPEKIDELLAELPQ